MQPPSTDTSFTDHVIAFGRVLRRLGFRVGPAHITTALEAVQAVGITRKDDVKAALKACFVQQSEERALFDQAFHFFWKAPSQVPEIMQWLLQTTQVPNTVDSKGYNRVQEALSEPAEQKETPAEENQKDPAIELDQIVTYSPSEILRKKDFAAFTSEEIAAAKRYMQKLTWPLPPYPVRRLSPSSRGKRLDLRKTTRNGLRNHGELVRLCHKGPLYRMRPLVLLCDISGSMERYARMLLHFMYSVVQKQQRVESFVFGTRLTRITHYLTRKDIDDALNSVSKHVFDWSGGTKIGESIKAFNYEWLRRVLKSTSIVLIISDGWDRGDTGILHREIGRLSRSCHRLIWLNPLMGFDGYEPLTRGMQAALPHVDDLLPVHNLHSLEQLGTAIASIR